MATFTEEAVEKMRAEIRETQAVVETANDFLIGTDKLIDEVNAAKQDADAINDAM